VRYVWLTFPTLLALSATVRGQQPTPPQKELAGAIRMLMLLQMPDPLVATQSNWGAQVDGVFVAKRRNHGTWRRLNITAFNPKDLLQIEVRNLASPESTRHTFDMILDMPVAIKFEQQLWERGVRLWNGSTAARAKTRTTLQCEAITRLDNSKGLLPDIVFRLRVIRADLTYRDVDVIHLAKFGGDAAAVLGKALHNCLRETRPDIERELLQKANTAIVKAGDTKEIRLSLSKLLK